MHNNDWSLIIFTLLSQMSVGIIITLATLYFCFPQSSQYLQQGSILKSPQFVALLAIGLATLISFLHLGYPAHAFNAANNLSSSWLSREILGIGIFGMGVLLVFIQFWMKCESSIVQGATIGLSAIIGLGLIFVMSKIYMMPTIPAWNTWFTSVHFYMSAFIIGVMVVLGFLMKDPDSMGFLKLALRLVSALLLLQLLAAFLYKNHMIKLDETGIGQPEFKVGVYHILYLVRCFMIFVSAMFAAYLSIKLSSIEVNYDAIIRFYAFVFLLIIVEELIGRFMFYAGYFREGV